MTEIWLGSLVFVAIVLVLVVLVLSARAVLLPTGQVSIRVNGRHDIEAPLGGKLLGALSEAGVTIPSACGGAGSCGQCRVTVTEGGGGALATEAALLSRADIRDGVRLACQVSLRGDMALTLPESLLSAQEWACTVVSSRTVAPLIREIVLALPDDADFSFTPGAFVQITAPAYALRYADYDIAPEHLAAWEAMGLRALASVSNTATARAYSIANTPESGDGCIVLLVRLALPPPDRPGAPPGVVSSWLFGVKAGDRVRLAGPFGSFAAHESDREMLFIGGGVGMAPLRAIISDQLLVKRTPRKISFWYGARSKVDLFYKDEFDRLEADHPNFSWTVALSDPAAGDDWHGETGFVHEVVARRYLADHPAPEACDYYLCGPPMMIRAVLAMLDDLGVDADHIFNDDFGG
ncbi:MAG: NADH:ubiquinone reductase (Na(+)-transporting) subunit F [Rhodobacteraceae bacterium]|nr:NADH:ubiquinone reductase (Na(+)-transporting) subunit F [Paracoccaceae bacterium]